MFISPDRAPTTLTIPRVSARAIAAVTVWAAACLACSKDAVEPNVDRTRIGYAGFSYGGAMGVLFVGIERRLKAAALVVADPGLVTHNTGAQGFKYISGLPCARRAAWIQAMAPIEPIRFIGNANVPLLFQNGTLDEAVPKSDAAELHAAAPGPKEIRWYQAGHGLNQQDKIDRLNWFQEKIGLDTMVGGVS